MRNSRFGESLARASFYLFVAKLRCGSESPRGLVGLKQVEQTVGNYSIDFHTLDGVIELAIHIDLHIQTQRQERHQGVTIRFFINPIGVLHQSTSPYVISRLTP